MPFRKIKFFAELHEGEQVYLVLRRHWVLPGSKVIFWIVLIVLLGILEEFLKTNFPGLADSPWEIVLTAVRSMVVMTGVLGLFMVWVMYYLNVQIITNERIVDINQKSLLDHQTAELNLDRFQDVTTEIRGPLANFFNYGNVRVQTAGEQQNFIFNDVPNPHQVAKIILELYEKIREEQHSDQSGN